MGQFRSVNVVKRANIYFDGRVTSRTIEFDDGSIRTLGIMLPGEYEFRTGKPELMEIQAGTLTYCLAGESEWHATGAGQSFHVPGDSSFRVRVSEITDYVCSFL